MKIVEPKTEQEFAKYYDLRWRILRAPWGQPPGSEKDELEDESIHLMACQTGIVLGVIRAHFKKPHIAQIRYMAVDDKYQGKGIGSKLLKEIEKRIKAKGGRQIVLNAREVAVEFYEERGYEIVGKAHMLYGTIEHFKMAKLLSLP
jgi:ribosomal protein S18 acetylase RimI-like enzyme